jgi:predicted chitinase
MSGADTPAASPPADARPAAGTRSSGVQSGVVEQLSKAAAILGSLIAVGQGGSQLVQSHYQHKIELTKADQELKLSKQKSDAALASEFLKLILDSNTSEKDRALLLGALAAIPEHPLQAWAKERRDRTEKLLQDLETADQAQLAALNEADGKVHDLEGQIKFISLDIMRVQEDPEKAGPMRKQRRELSEQLALAKATQRASQVVAAPAYLGGKLPKVGATRVTVQLPIEKIRSVLPHLSGERATKQTELFNKYMPFIGPALTEYGLTEPSVIAAVLATVIHETAGFTTVEDYSSDAAYENRASLGNTQPGDGVKYKGRGLLQITGRANYAKFSEMLGLATRLVDSPDEVNDPDVAARLLCLWFVKPGAKAMGPLSEDDLRTIRIRVNGGLNGWDDFYQLYTRILPLLSSDAR